MLWFRAVPMASLLIGFWLIFGPVPGAPWRNRLPLIVLPAMAIIGFAVIRIRGTGLKKAAVFADIRGQFAERLSTSMDVPETCPMAEPLFRQAEQCCRKLPPSSLSYWSRSPRTIGLLVGLGLLLAGLGLLPLHEPSAAEATTVRNEQAANAAEELDQHLVQIEKQLPRKDWPEVADELARIRKLAWQIREGKIDPREGLALMEEAAERLADMKAKQEAGEKATEQLARNPTTSALAESAGQGTDEAGQGAKKLAQKLTDPATDAATRQGACQSLEQAAQAAKDNPELQKQLRRAAEAIRDGNSRKAAEELAQAARQCAQSMQQQRSKELVARACDAVGQCQGGMTGQDGKGLAMGEGGSSDRDGDQSSGLSTDLNAPSGPGGYEDPPGVGSAGRREDLYAPKPVKTSGENLIVPGEPGNAPPVAVQNELGPGMKDQPTTRPTPGQWKLARQRAEKALEKQQIPARYRDLIREYFRPE